MRCRLRFAAALALAPLLSGCIAIAALPVLAGGAMIAGGNARIRAATPRPSSAARIKPTTPAQLAEPHAELPATAVAPGVGLIPTNLAELPQPDPGVRDGWGDFIAYALRRADLPSSGRASSALLIPGTSLLLPQMRPCEARVPAVIVDLDPGQTPFAPRSDPASPPSTPPALAAGLARLRAAGIAVLWLSELPAAEVGAVAEALRASGLDPAGTDPLLLVRSGADRKQVLRVEAGADVCVIAIAGDRRGDFDELFDYLRDPQSAAALDTLLGSGWFIVPPPFE